MSRICACFKNISVWLAFLLGLLFMLAALGVFWLVSQSVSKETVFWQAIDNNLNSRSVVLDTEISTVIQTGETSVLNSRLGLNFAPETSFGWYRQLLLYDQNLAGIYPNFLQLEGYVAAGITDLPQQEWYDQVSYGSDSTVHLSHNLVTRPAIDGWVDNFTGVLTKPDLGDGLEVTTEGPERMQRFLMNSLVNGHILLHGKLPPDERQQIIAQLREAYLVDFDRVRAVRQDDRLLYEYDVQIDYVRFAPAFADYYNANLAGEAWQALSDEQAASIFFGQPTIQTIVVDAWSRQVVEVRHPLQLAAEFTTHGGGLFEDEEFFAMPYYSQLINDLAVGHDAELQVVTKVLNRNQMVDVRQIARPPASSADSQ